MIQKTCEHRISKTNEGYFV